VLFGNIDRGCFGRTPCPGSLSHQQMLAALREELAVVDHALEVLCLLRILLGMDVCLNPGSRRGCMMERFDVGDHILRDRPQRAAGKTSRRNVKNASGCGN
jgi:hypothetical protein